MLARLHVFLPFVVAIPTGEHFPAFETELEGYRVQIYPLVETDLPVQGVQLGEMSIEGVPVFSANGLRVDFIKSEFDRSEAVECDPPAQLINRVVNSFLVRLRTVTNGINIRPITFPLGVTWRLRYLTDDETELEPQEGLARERGSLSFRFSWAVLNNAVWTEMPYGQT